MDYDEDCKILLELEFKTTNQWILRVWLKKKTAEKKNNRKKV